MSHHTPVVAGFTLEALIKHLKAGLTKQLAYAGSSRKVYAQMQAELAVVPVASVGTVATENPFAAAEELESEPAAAGGISIGAKLGRLRHKFEDAEIPEVQMFADEYQYHAKWLEFVANNPTLECGKGQVGFFKTPLAVDVDLGADAWRKIELFSSQTHATYALDVDGYTPVSKGELGDGTFAIVRPETLGLPAGTRTALQTRAYITDANAETGADKLFWFLKGLVIVDPDATSDRLSLTDGYGRSDLLAAGQTLTLEQMTDISEYNPKGRVGIQTLTYEGVKGWGKFFNPAARISANDSRQALDGERLTAAGMPIKFLPVTEIIRISRGLLEGLVTIKWVRAAKQLASKGRVCKLLYFDQVHCARRYLCAIHLF